MEKNGLNVIVNVLAGFMSGLGRTGDPVGFILGEHLGKKGKEKPFFMGRAFDNYLPDNSGCDKTALEFKVAKFVGDVTGIGVGVVSFGLPQMGCCLANVYFNAIGMNYDNIFNHKE